ncbi:MAG: uncharacterized protein QOI62_1042 [Solirubrobacteraceae bacterium]|jgi:uncharacterized protein with von Willebrand factor type A (vWA) domain|nr:uncharacterized protein [Solirubrobacteraceae bacterium]
MAASAATDCHLGRRLVAFCHLLRAHGLGASSTEVRAAVDAALVVDLSEREEFRLALRTTLTSAPEELPLFDELFDQFWGAPPEQGSESGFGPDDSPGAGTRDTADDAVLSHEFGEDSAAQAREDEEEHHEEATHSPAEVLAKQDFRGFHADDMSDVAHAIMALTRKLATRPSRRRRPSRRLADIDLRRTMRRNLHRYGDTVLELHGRERKLRRTRLVLLCDVSRSMALYSRFLLVFVYAMQRHVGRVESFVFSTRLTRVTPFFRRGSILAALDRIAAEVPDWAGGTRIGSSLGAFEERYGALLDSRTVVIVLSDGLDTDEPEEIARAMRRIAKRSGRVVWLNPMLGIEGYEPLARGMSAALPYVDDFAPAHNLASLHDLVRRLPAVG